MHPDLSMAPDARPDPVDPAGIHLSALMDGQADAVATACAQWRDDPSARRQWHRYQLIGDALRAEQLQVTPAGDAAFLQRLRQRLAAEPAALAPTVLAVASDGLRAPAPGRGPAALSIAASVLLLFGAMWVARTGPTPLSVASLSPAGPVARPALSTDPRLDEFLRVHRAAGGGLGLVASGGTLRRVDLLLPNAAQP